MFCLLVVLPKLSLLDKWLARKTPLKKPNHGEGIVSIKPRPKSAHDFLGLLYCFVVLLCICVVFCPYVIYYPTVMARPICAQCAVKPQTNNCKQSRRSFNSYFFRTYWINSLSLCWMLLELGVMEMVVTAGAVRHAQLQSSRHQQQTKTRPFTGQIPFLSPNQQYQSTGRKGFFRDNFVIFRLGSKRIAFLESVNFYTCVNVQLFNFCNGHVTSFWHPSGIYICKMPGQRLQTMKRHNSRVLAFHRYHWFWVKLFDVGCAQDSRRLP